MTCQYCDEAILPGEVNADNPTFHRECIIRAVIGSAAHQLGECPCHGGDREDPPGLTPRQAASLAYDCFLALRQEAE